MDYTADAAYSNGIRRRRPGASSPPIVGTWAKDAVCVSSLTRLTGGRRCCSYFRSGDLGYPGIRNNIKGFHAMPPTSNIRPTIHLECPLVYLWAYSVWMCIYCWPYECDGFSVSSDLRIAMAFFFHPTTVNHQLQYMSPVGIFVVNNIVTDFTAYLGLFQIHIVNYTHNPSLVLFKLKWRSPSR